MKATYGYAIAAYIPPTEAAALEQLEFKQGQKLKVRAPRAQLTMLFFSGSRSRHALQRARPVQLYNRHENGWWRADLHHARGHIITGYVSVYYIDPFRCECDFCLVPFVVWHN